MELLNLDEELSNFSGYDLPCRMIRRKVLVIDKLPLEVLNPIEAVAADIDVILPNGHNFLLVRFRKGRPFRTTGPTHPSGEEDDLLLIVVKGLHGMSGTASDAP